MSTDTPTEEDVEAGEAGLGPLREDLRGSPQAVLSRSWWLLAIGVLTGGGWLVCMTLLVIEAVNGGGLAVFGGFVPFCYWPAFLLIPMVALLFRARRASGWRVRVYAHGLVQQRGGERQVVRWDDLVAMERTNFDREQGDPGGALVLACRDGRKVTVDADLARFDVLLVVVESELFARLWPDVERRFEAGERVVFGSLRVNRQGLTVEGFGFEVLPWPEVESIRRDSSTGIVTICREGGLLNWFSGRIPNAHLFLAVAERARELGPLQPP